MTNVLILLGGGFVLGLKHALDADHLAAVGTLVAETKDFKKASAMGAVWGLGHTLTLFLASIAVLLFKSRLPANISEYFETVIGALLILLGLRLFWKINHGAIEAPHSHDFHRPFLIGVAHGLAGSATLTLLALTTADKFSYGLWFIAVFGAGSIIGMMIASSILSVPFIVAARMEKLNKYFTIAAGLVSIIIGAFAISNHWPK